jgi:hypothetical protein
MSNFSKKLSYFIITDNRFILKFIGKIRIEKKKTVWINVLFFVGFEPKTFISLTLLPELVISNSLQPLKVVPFHLQITKFFETTEKQSVSQKFSDF